MAEYRRGIEKGVWQKHWHFHDHCARYPRNSFAIRSKKPDEDELCAACDALAHGH
jgi:hypothetical protein